MGTAPFEQIDAPGCGSRQQPIDVITVIPDATDGHRAPAAPGLTCRRRPDPPPGRHHPYGPPGRPT
ncbi:hypothetical protein ATKI12_4889 [Kitasatospora sp. Ki12]